MSNGEFEFSLTSPRGLSPPPPPPPPPCDARIGLSSVFIDYGYKQVPRLIKTKYNLHKEHSVSWRIVAYVLKFISEIKEF